MELQKTIRLKLSCLTTTKEALLRQEWEAWQSHLRHGEKADQPLYSATTQQAERLRRKLGGRLNPTKNYPMVLRRDVTRVEKARHTSWSKWWMKVPVAGLRGGVWCPVQMAPNHEALLDDPNISIREAKLIRRRTHWSVHLVVRKEVMPPSLDAHPNILAVDLGERNPAAAVLMAPGSSMRPEFYGREVRGVRRHHAWLRKRLQGGRAFRTLKKMGDREAREVRAVLHRTTKDLVERAVKERATIVLGAFSGGHRNTKRGRRFNRIVNSMPFGLVSSLIRDKAAWRGVPVVLVNEDYSSQECHRCGNPGRRPSQAEFRCITPSCGWRGHADMNGAFNLGKRWERFQALIGWNGAASIRPMNPAG
jgi:putative transposase